MQPPHRNRIKCRQILEYGREVGGELVRCWLVSKCYMPGVERSAYSPRHAGILRRVAVKGMKSVSATVVVAVVQGNVWMSISPPFTWEAIMEPGKVDELISVLVVARADAEKVGAARSSHASDAGGVVRAITNGR